MIFNVIVLKEVSWLVQDKVIFTLALDKPPGFEAYCEPKTKYSKNKIKLNETTFSLQKEKIGKTDSKVKLYFTILSINKYFKTKMLDFFLFLFFK